jgi:hypothetical protein
MAPDPSCLTKLTPAQLQTGGENVVADDSNLFLGTSDGAVRAFVFDVDNWTKNISWGGGTGSVVVGDSFVSALALTDRVIGTTSLRGAFALARSSGALVANLPDGGLLADPGPPSIGQDRVIFGDGTSLVPALFAASLDLASAERTPTDAGGLATSPVVAAGALIYTVSLDGQLQLRTLDLTLQWAERISSNGAFRASPTIDCVRDSGVPISAKTGVLYAASQGGALFAVIVDSPGLDATAPWPKYQHDIRNTGNPNTPISSCP